MNTASLGTASQKYNAVLCSTLLYFWYNWFVIYSQNKMVCDSFSIADMTSDVDYIDIFSVS